MSALPWDPFEKLPGASHRNWEVLCRELIRRHYERFGPLKTRKNQPGVEFHLEVERDGSSLGEPGRHWGWQCRWYEGDSLRSGGNLRADQRRGIEEAIAKSAEHVNGLTDWVLWTRSKLSAEDARWLERLDGRAPFTLHHYEEEALVGMLSGDAAILRETWFGELTLDRGRLSNAHEEALAPIRERYEEELHVHTPSESEILALMPSDDLEETVERLQGRAIALVSSLRASPLGPEDPDIDLGLSWVLYKCIDVLSDVQTAVADGGLPSVQEIAAGIEALEPGTAVQPRRAKAGYRQEAEELLLDTLSWMKRLHVAVATPMVAAVGGAGAGKTHLAADLTGPVRNAGGVLVLGRQFGAEIDDDSIAAKSGLAGSRDELLEALEAMGAREGRRVPLVIDGLNEAREPGQWKVALARLRARLAKLPHVLAVVTLRPSYWGRCVPDEVPRVEVTGFEAVQEEAVRRYFAYYKIDVDPVAIQWWRPADPLMLSLFCRTVNPTRSESVGSDRLPGSLHEVFELHLEGVANRTAVRMNVDPEAVQEAIDRLAKDFFDKGAREVGRATVSEILEDERWAAWEKTLRFNLEAEGLLLRDEGEGREVVLFSYDLLAGHAIARAVLGDHPDRRDLATDSLAAQIEVHPLREDIVIGLSGLVAREGGDLVALLASAEELRIDAVLASGRLAPSEVGPATIEGIRDAFAARPADTFEAIRFNALRSGHPLSAAALDVLLAGLALPDRDLGWSEWLRLHAEPVRNGLQGLSASLREGDEMTASAATLAWLSWILTSTDKGLRDEAIQGLYLLGRRHPQALFSRALSMLRLNDPWVAEGLLAAGYGVAMAAQDPAHDNRAEVERFALALTERLLAEDATEPTWNWLIREYAYRVNQLAAWLSEGSFAAPAEAAQPPLPGPDLVVERFLPDGDYWKAAESAFDLDFSIGGLVEGRKNNDEYEPRFRALIGEIRARVAELGWRVERFGEVDRRIDSVSARRGGYQIRLERYGEKYGWIGFFEAAGRLSDAGQLGSVLGGHYRLPNVLIDPSFPRDAMRLALPLAPWVTSRGSDEGWVCDSSTEIPHELLRTRRFGQRHAWVALDGRLSHAPAESKRKASCSIRGLLALDGWTGMERFVAEHGVSSETVPRNPSDNYCFAGEAPWAPTFDHFGTAPDGTAKTHRFRLGYDEGPEVEVLAVDFEWSRHHSALNDVRIDSLPAKHLAQRLRLRKLADRPEFVDAEGLLAAIGVGIYQEDWHGYLLYLREDLLRGYCAEQGGDWGWIATGEREVLPADSRRGEAPIWLRRVRATGRNRFSRVVQLDRVPKRG